MLWKSIQCDFDLKLFPFDQQSCSIDVIISNVPKASVEIVKIGNTSSYSFEGISTSEFFIKYVIMIHRKEKMCFKFLLVRYFKMYLYSTYFQTILLHIIGYFTLYLHPDDFQVRGAMSLTTLLVLILLYSDALDDLPVTSYLKFLDIWYIFSIAFLSSIIAVHLATNVNSNKLVVLFKIRNYIQLIGIPHLLKISRYFLFLVYFLFIVAYWTYLFIESEDSNIKLSKHECFQN